MNTAFAKILILSDQIKLDFQVIYIYIHTY